MTEYYGKKEEKTNTPRPFFKAFGVIDNTMADKFVDFVVSENLKDTPVDRLLVLINSPGGYVMDFMAMYEIMQSSRIPIHTFAIGQAASCGILFLMSGAVRYSTHKTCLMSHTFSAGHFGKSVDLFARQKDYKQVEKRIYDIYEYHTGLSKKEIKKHLLPATDVYLSAQEAKEFGIIDHIVDRGELPL